MKAEELRGMIPKELLEGVGSAGEVVEGFRGQKEARVLVFGSLFLIGEVLAALGVDAEDLVTYRVD